MSNRYNVTVKVNNAVVSQEKDLPRWLARATNNAISDSVYKAIRKDDTSLKLGECGSVTIEVSWMLARQTREWSAATKAKVLANNAAKRAQQQAKWQKEHEERQKKETALLQARVKAQVDHAFALGKTGTEPAAKFITCHCNAPAAILGLSQPLAGAAVIDENTIVGALCAEHAPKQGYYNPTSNWAETIPCDRLEFFFDGVRAIAVKQ
jgi:hypothetical protein